MIERGSSSHRAVSALCSIGLFIAGYIFYSSALLEFFYAKELQLCSSQIGLAQAAVPLGAILGAMIAGKLADHFGRHRLLLLNFKLLVLTSILNIFTFNYVSLCSLRFINGFLAGTLYPLSATYLTEMTPRVSLSKRAAFSMFVNCLAAPAACVLAMLLSFICSPHLLWRLLAAGHVLPAIIAVQLAKTLPESQAWVYFDKESHHVNAKQSSALQSIKMLFSKQYRNLTLLLMSAWFLMDVAYYGINFFLPTLLETMHIDQLSAQWDGASLLSHSIVWATFIISLFFIVGASLAIFVIDKMPLLKLQQYGFLLGAVSLLLLATYYFYGQPQSFYVILLFILFNFSLNIGPDVTTYLLSATAYPTQFRASGHGFNASVAKAGSFLAVLLIPSLQQLLGFEKLILLLASVLLLAFFITKQLANLLTQPISMDEDIVYETN